MHLVKTGFIKMYRKPTIQPNIEGFTGVLHLYGRSIGIGERQCLHVGFNLRCRVTVGEGIGWLHCFGSDIFLTLQGWAWIVHPAHGTFGNKWVSNYIFFFSEYSTPQKYKLLKHILIESGFDVEYKIPLPFGIFATDIFSLGDSKVMLESLSLLPSNTSPILSRAFIALVVCFLLYIEKICHLTLLQDQFSSSSKSNNLNGFPLPRI